MLYTRVSFKQHERAHTELPFSLISLAVGMAVVAALFATYDYTLTDIRYLIRF